MVMHTWQTRGLLIYACRLDVRTSREKKVLYLLSGILFKALSPHPCSYMALVSYAYLKDILVGIRFDSSSAAFFALFSLDQWPFSKCALTRRTALSPRRHSCATLLCTSSMTPSATLWRPCWKWQEKNNQHQHTKFAFFVCLHFAMPQVHHFT